MLEVVQWLLDWREIHAVLFVHHVLLPELIGGFETSWPWPQPGIGHTSVVTLRRYLGWGSIGTAKKTTMTTAAAALAPTGGRRHDPYSPLQTAGPPSYEESVRHRNTQSAVLGHEHERWLQFLGMEAPPLDALPVATSLGDPNELPLMSKDVAAVIDMVAVRRVIDPTTPPDLAPDLAQWSANIPSELKRFASEAFGWLHDQNKYQSLLQQLDAPQATRPTRIRRNACCHLSVTWPWPLQA